MWLTLFVGVVTLAVSMAVQALASGLVLKAVNASSRRRWHERGFWAAVAILQMTCIFLFASFLVQIVLWAAVYMLIEERLQDFHRAFYHSANNYTTLSYGEAVLSARWQLLAPIEAANGIVMAGLAAAVLFAVMSRISEDFARSRHREHRPPGA